MFSNNSFSYLEIDFNNINLNIVNNQIILNWPNQSGILPFSEIILLKNTPVNASLILPNETIPFLCNSCLIINIGNNPIQIISSNGENVCFISSNNQDSANLKKIILINNSIQSSKCWLNIPMGIDDFSSLGIDMSGNGLSANSKMFSNLPINYYCPSNPLSSIINQTSNDLGSFVVLGNNEFLSNINYQLLPSSNMTVGSYFWIKNNLSIGYDVNISTAGSDSINLNSINNYNLKTQQSICICYTGNGLYNIMGANSLFESLSASVLNINNNPTLFTTEDILNLNILFESSYLTNDPVIVLFPQGVPGVWFAFNNSYLTLTIQIQNTQNSIQINPFQEILFFSDGNFINDINHLQHSNNPENITINDSSTFQGMLNINGQLQTTNEDSTINFELDTGTNILLTDDNVQINGPLQVYGLQSSIALQQNITDSNNFLVQSYFQSPNIPLHLLQGYSPKIIVNGNSFSINLQQLDSKGNGIFNSFININLANEPYVTFSVNGVDMTLPIPYGGTGFADFDSIAVLMFPATTWYTTSLNICSFPVYSYNSDTKTYSWGLQPLLANGDQVRYHLLALKVNPGGINQWGFIPMYKGGV